MPDAAPPLLLAGDAPGTDPLETARSIIGELGHTGWVPFPDPRSAEPTSGEPWLLLRTTLLLADSSVDVQPYGPRLLTGRTRLSADQSEALRLQLESFHLAMSLEAGASPSEAQPAVTMTILGPITLAASLFSLGGERLVADHGAVSYLAEALADGAAELSARTRSAHGLSLEFTLAEPLLTDALLGRIPTSSGWRTHRHLTREQLRSAYRAWKDGSQGTPSRLVSVASDSSLGGMDHALEAAEAGALSSLSVQPSGAGWMPADVEALIPLMESEVGMLVDAPFTAVGSSPSAVRSWLTRLLESFETVGVPEDLRAAMGLWLPEGLRSAGPAASSVLRAALDAAEEIRQTTLTGRAAE